MSTATPTFTVEIREVRPQPYLGLKLRAPLEAVGPQVQAAFAALYRRLAATGITPTGPPFLISQQPEGGYLDMELGAPCAGLPEPGEGFQAQTLPGGRVAVTVHRGAYDAIGPVYGRLARWIADQHLAMTGPPREVYMSPPEEEEEPVTEIVWPIA